jgi:NAD(P)-dependent dehydrogenase (short-subunit alcohol dehydrogenase family)
MKFGAIYPSLKNRTVLVTGGASGIGEKIVEEFARQGAKVAFFDILDKPARALAARLTRKKQKVHYEHVDLTDIAALRAGVDRVRKLYGPVTVLVNNAAMDERHKWEDVTPEYFDSRIALNLRHHFFAIQAVVPDMKKAGYGSIVSMSSLSWMVGSRDMPIYVAAKAGIYGLVRGMARELGRMNIRINAISPGWIMTERQIRLWSTPEALEQLMKDQCLQRTIEPAEIARAILFMASDEASAATNQNFVFDAGWQ